MPKISNVYRNNKLRIILGSESVRLNKNKGIFSEMMCNSEKAHRAV